MKVLRGKDSQCTARCTVVRTDTVIRHVSELDEKTWKMIQSLCQPSLFLCQVASLFLANVFDSVLIHCFALTDDLLKVYEGINFGTNDRIRFFFVTFSHGVVIIRQDWQFRRSATCMNTFKASYKCLCLVVVVVVVVQRLFRPY